MSYEYGVVHYRYPDELHRGPYATKTEAESWVYEWLHDGGAVGVFHVVEREVDPWRLTSS